MPRVANDRKSFANRMIEKVVALRSELGKYDAVLKNLSKIQKDDPTFAILSDYLRKIEADRDSIVVTIVGMHEKMITSDFSTFVDFATALAIEVSNDADADHAAILAKEVAE